MSRTYRVRHLPRLKAKKFVEANIDTRRRTNALLDGALREYMPEVFGEDGGLRWAYWGLRWCLLERIELEKPAAVAPVTLHPWVDWGRTSAVKTEYKRSGNRVVRRHNRAVLRNFAYLGDEVDDAQRFYDKKDGWNIWALY